MCPLALSTVQKASSVRSREYGRAIQQGAGTKQNKGGQASLVELIPNEPRGLGGYRVSLIRRDGVRCCHPGPPNRNVLHKPATSTLHHGSRGWLHLRISALLRDDRARLHKAGLSTFVPDVLAPLRSCNVSLPVFFNQHTVDPLGASITNRCLSKLDNRVMIFRHA